MRPPTSQLPPIKSIKTTPLEELQNAVDYLWKMYNPTVRGSLRRRKNNNPRSSPAILDILRTDTFERNYSLKWLTALISQLETSDPDDGLPDFALLHEKLLNSAVSLLATCAGTASAGSIHRSFVFTTPNPLPLPLPSHTSDQLEKSFQKKITIELKDIPLDNNDYRSVGAQTWGSACVMADMIAEDPPSFGILPRCCWTVADERKPFSFRCLELGAGTGLVSMTIAQIMQLHLSTPESTDSPLDYYNIEIVPTDCFPSVLENLERNIQNNLTTERSQPIRVRSQYLDWSVFSQSEVASDPPILQIPFDEIYGADIVYEAQHAEWIKMCVLKLLKKPTKNDVSGEDPTFHLIIPLRSTHTAESNTIEQVFSETRGDDGDDNLIIKQKEVIVCDSETGSIEEVEYAYYKIGWRI